MSEQAVYLALGSNLGDRRANLEQAIQHINTRIGPVTKVSSFHETKALCPPGMAWQPDFLNAVLLCMSSHPPLEILRRIHVIEQLLGRVRAVHWGPRVIDIDILTVGDIRMQSEELTLPHPEMHKREFVMAPLLEIEPAFQLPVANASVSGVTA